MMHQLSFTEFQSLCRLGRSVPVFRRIPADLGTPVSVYHALREHAGESYLLESLEGGAAGRYSFLGLNPSLRLAATGAVITLHQEGVTREERGDPFHVLRRLLQERRMVDVAGLPPLIGGAIGIISYDTVRRFEALPDQHPVDAACADLTFCFYDTILAFDHHAQTCTISVRVPAGCATRADYELAVQRIDAILSQIAKASLPLPVAPRTVVAGAPDPVQVDLSDAEFAARVQRAQEYIRAGDAFQIVLSRSFQRRVRASAFDIYRALRMTSPAPYMFLLENGTVSVAGASPEKLVSVQDGVMETHPIAGTRPVPAEGDLSRIADELRNDPKECAEHMMLVDLARNDLGRIAAPGSVQASELASIQRLARVMHLRSRVTATLPAGRDALDALRATLPAGTLSGAPKIRAMEIIDELESSRRGLFGGAVCYFDNRGNMDSCIAIRMAVLQDGVATVRAGAGVVLDSDPASEARETRHKAAGVLAALELAEGGALCF